jgi:hypothetical protein
MRGKVMLTCDLIPLSSVESVENKEKVCTAEYAENAETKTEKKREETCVTNTEA